MLIYSNGEPMALHRVGAHLARSLQLTGYIANLLNLSGMSIDHYVGIVIYFHLIFKMIILKEIKNY